MVTWRCPFKHCRKTISIRVGSFFKRSHLELWQIIGITYLWTRCAKVEECRRKILEKSGSGRVVEIDESLFTRRKKNRGKIVEEQWIFSGYDVTTKKALPIPVERRDVATLIPIIMQWIRPGTVIWSDMWAAYGNLAAHGYQHGTVNHTYLFVDPITGVTTNRVEAMWQRSKSKFKAMFGSSNQEMIHDYLSELMWA
ncbi:uncharacterized protein LOC136083381 [Hydra vulgaris]|uniref:Uncharacterized protein LOC136083381 n=1 Tax=Hydra vulgaris TaxID=6087 RepID=A0ABM4CB04_HYDVU